MATLKEFMKEKNYLSRIDVLGIALIGALFGAIATYMMMLAGIVF